ncbi:hypothetical protein [Streptomyces sp. WZ.A104]|uniref:hypothetical protein n=1 Tax=Streptomyces sp. WZ.A104 TaxID=2023771 RepID=UPI00211C4D55|nr:hypothetical protein [Streptomyces sp. WZ.A104]
MNISMGRVYEVVSAGRGLEVRADSVFVSRWEEIAPHLPGVPRDGLRPGPDTSTDAVRLPQGARVGDVRRLLNAHLHLLHLAHGTLCLHAVALRHPADGRVVVLLGGHGAGKTLVALALFLRGWRVMAGDVTLMDCSAQGLSPRVVGGTAAFLARPGPTRRWFPDLVPSVAGEDRVDLSRVPGLWESPLTAPGAVAAAVLVDVDGDPAAGEGAVGVLDGHTAANVWWRASGHLLERLLDDAPVVLRLLEDDEAAVRRLSLVRALARTIPLHAAWGAPEPIADRIERLAHAAMPVPVTEVSS